MTDIPEHRAGYPVEPLRYGFGERFAEQAYSFCAAEADFRDNFDFDFSVLTYDAYDSSVEFKGADPKAALSEAQQRLIYDAGFLRCWICHKDGGETYYYWSVSFAVHPGSRRERPTT